MNKVTSPFALERVLFVRNVVISMQGFSPEHEAPLNIKNSIDVRRDEKDKNLFAATMRTIINPEQSSDHPYSIDMECVCGLQLIDPSLDDETAQRGATITAHSVLYGAIREATTWLTGRHPWGPLTLGLSVLQSGPSKPDSTGPDEN